MRKVSYKINGIETASYAEKIALEKQSGKRAEIVFTNVRSESTELPKVQKAMIEQFGYAHPSLKDEVVMP